MNNLKCNYGMKKIPVTFQIYFRNDNDLQGIIS